MSPQFSLYIINKVKNKSMYDNDDVINMWKISLSFLCACACLCVSVCGRKSIKTLDSSTLSVCAVIAEVGRLS